MNRSVAAWLCGAMTVLPLAAWAAAPGAMAGEGTFSPPETQLLLTRVLHSPLADGGEVVARRRYAVRIEPEGDGFRVDGELLGCDVDAPPMLRTFAEIERKRPDRGLFPMRLDRTGMLMSPAVPPRPGDALRNAAAEAARALRASGLHNAERTQAQGFVAQMQDRAADTPWPGDLFRPAPGRRVDEQRFPLPDGGEGRITVEINARSDSARGVLSEFERTVVTEMAGSKRTTREEWKIAHAQ